MGGFLIVLIISVSISLVKLSRSRSTGSPSLIASHKWLITVFVVTPIVTEVDS